MIRVWKILEDMKMKSDVIKTEQIIIEHHRSFWNIPQASMTMLQEDEVGGGSLKIDSAKVEKQRVEWSV